MAHSNSRSDSKGRAGERWRSRSRWKEIVLAAVCDVDRDRQQVSEVALQLRVLDDDPEGHPGVYFVVNVKEHPGAGIVAAGGFGFQANTSLAGAVHLQVRDLFRLPLPCSAVNSNPTVRGDAQSGAPKGQCSEAFNDSDSPFRSTAIDPQSLMASS